MISFVIALIVLIAGYIIYGTIVTRIFGADPKRPTPATTMADGVDYVEMPVWKVFLIQFLNIAGLGPIFGAIMGVMFGPAAFLWIVFGTIFAGGVHDYLSGMLSLRNNGISQPEIVGKYLGFGVKRFIRFWAFVLMVLVGAVFVYNPADILASLTPPEFNRLFWVVLIFAYYLLATLLPIDKLIGRIYPIFGVALLFMAVAIMGSIFMHSDSLPEMWEGFYNHRTDAPIFPMMFVSIACGAISGFHGTQAPMMARCMKNERHGQLVFYGAMVTEGVVALIWAAAAITFTGGYEQLSENLAGGSPAVLINDISRSWLGTVGGILAVLGVVAAPITSGDTALRSARLIAADFLKIDQRTITKRLAVTLPVCLVCFVIMMLPYQVLWRYFAWSNQVLATFTLWALTVYLAYEHKAYFITLIPALFMTVVTSTYLLCAPEGLPLAVDALGFPAIPYSAALAVGVAFAALMIWIFSRSVKSFNKLSVAQERI